MSESPKKKKRLKPIKQRPNETDEEYAQRKLERRRLTYKRYYRRGKKPKQKEAAKEREKARKKAKAEADAIKKAAKEAKQKEERERKAALKTPEARAQAELARRELARRHLLPYIHRFMPGYQAGWFHKDLCLHLEQFLQDVVDQKSPRLMLFVPPRHGKSITVSQNFPGWALGKYPQMEFISTSYAESLQLDFSKKIKEQIRSKEWQVLFPGITIPKNYEATARWQLARHNKLTGGGMLAAGVGGPLTGRGMAIGLIDDPIKNAEEADSETVRRSIKDWYSSTFYTRLAPGGGILIVQTRWHDDDLSGWLLHEMGEAEKEMRETGEWPADAVRWQVIDYPAIATKDEKYRKKGEALHPERFSLEQLKITKRTLIPRHWSALYQQNPVAEEGQFFTKNMLRYYKPGGSPPLRNLDIYCAADLAISTKETADYTVFVIAGLDKDDNLWILDVRRDRWDTDGIINQIVDIHQTWKPLRIGIERDKVAIAIGPPLNMRIRKDRLYNLHVEELHIAGRDKRTRARPIQGRMAQGMVLLPESALWLEQWVNEFLRFDSGVNDDCVDAGAWLGQMLADVTFRGMGRGRKKLKSWKDKLSSLSGVGTGNHMRA
jgi:predicted phage terminase large subunit-like protein